MSERIIGCALQVLNALDARFFEKVYENALAHELRKLGLTVAQQQAITVTYDGVVVGDYSIDPLVEGTISVELKATGLRLCLLLNLRDLPWRSIGLGTDCDAARCHPRASEPAPDLIRGASAVELLAYTRRRND